MKKKGDGGWLYSSFSPPPPSAPTPGVRSQFDKREKECRCFFPTGDVLDAPAPFPPYTHDIVKWASTNNNSNINNNNNMIINT